MTTKVIEDTLKNAIRENEELAVALCNADYQDMNTYYHIAICYHKAKALSSAMFDLFGYGYTTVQEDDLMKIMECISTLEVTTSCYEIDNN